MKSPMIMRDHAKADRQRFIASTTSHSRKLQSAINYLGDKYVGRPGSTLVYQPARPVAGMVVRHA